MADDNILAGLGGFLGGIRDVYVPYALKDIEERRKKIPITRVEALSGIKTGLDPNELVTPDELGIIKSRIGAQSLKGLYDTEGNIVDYVPRFSSQIRKPLETPEEKLGRAKELESFKVSLVGKKEEEKSAAGKKADKPRVLKTIQNTVSDYDKAIKMANDIKSRVSKRDFIFQKVPLTESKAIAAKLDTLKTKIGFAALQEMREQSKTGGALGQIAIKEGEWLQNSEFPLGLDLPVEELKKNLDDLISGYTESKQNILNAYKTEYGEKYKYGEEKKEDIAQPAIKPTTKPKQRVPLSNFYR